MATKSIAAAKLIEDLRSFVGRSIYVWGGIVARWLVLTSIIIPIGYKKYKCFS